MGLEAKGTFPFQMYQIPEFTATTVTTSPILLAKVSADKPRGCRAQLLVVRLP